MIRMAYLDDASLREQVTEDYLTLMNSSYLKRRWREVRNDNPELRNIGFSTTALLVSDFGTLVRIAQAYDKAMIGLSEERIREINTAVADVFNYDRYYQRAKMAPFFREHAEVLKIHTCHYCDMAYINVYNYVDVKDGRKKTASHFDLDHVLEKSRYPLLALSLFNLVPSCPICNERLKGSDPLAKGAPKLKKLSPTSPLFQFDQKVLLTLLPFEDARRPFLQNPDCYELDFDCHKEPAYQALVDRFRLKDRYNYHKTEALRIKDLKLKYPDANIMRIANILGYSFEDVKEDIFGQRFSEKEHRCFSKLKRDMLR